MKSSSNSFSIPLTMSSSVIGERHWDAGGAGIFVVCIASSRADSSSSESSSVFAVGLSLEYLQISSAVFAPTFEKLSTKNSESGSSDAAAILLRTPSSIPYG